jgi:hypothetical protein
MLNEQKLGKSLNEVQQGDTVIMTHSAYGLDPEVVQVEHATLKFIHVRGIKFRRNGTEVDSFPRHAIVQFDQKIVDEIERRNRAKSQIRTLDSTKWLKVSEEKRLRILAILDEE